MRKNRDVATGFRIAARMDQQGISVSNQVIAGGANVHEILVGYLSVETFRKAKAQS
jgi:hypothetical protein